MHSETLIPDHTVIVDGALIKQLTEKTLKCADILIHESLVAYLESQARIGTAQGNIGSTSSKTISTHERRNHSQIRRKKTPDTIPKTYSRRPSTQRPRTRNRRDIRHFETLTTKNSECSRNHSSLHRTTCSRKKMQIEQFFDETTMSVHLREKVQPMRKRGKPRSLDVRHDTRRTPYR